jgi:hypothetical protein
MSNVGVHSFQIPHEYVQPTRDMVIVRIPLPPSKIGSILTPDITRDMMQHNVMAGRVAGMGPLAFSYKSGEDTLEKQDVQIGDWVLFRPFAGTMIQGGKLMATNGWRYMSSFNDVIGIIKAEHMPDPATLEWETPDAHAETLPAFDWDHKIEVNKWT